MVLECFWDAFGGHAQTHTHTHQLTVGHLSRGASTFRGVPTAHAADPKPSNVNMAVSPCVCVLSVWIDKKLLDFQFG